MEVSDSRSARGVAHACDEAGACVCVCVCVCVRVCVCACWVASLGCDNATCPHPQQRHAARQHDNVLPLVVTEPRRPEDDGDDCPSPIIGLFDAVSHFFPFVTLPFLAARRVK